MAVMSDAVRAFLEGVRFGVVATINADGRIGNFLMTGSQVMILGRADHAVEQVGVPMLLSEWIGDRESRAADAVDIGDDVWIGAGAIVLGGAATLAVALTWATAFPALREVDRFPRS